MYVTNWYLFDHGNHFQEKHDTGSLWRIVHVTPRFQKSIHRMLWVLTVGPQTQTFVISVPSLVPALTATVLNLLTK